MKRLGGEEVSASPWQRKAFQKTVRQFSLGTKCTKCEVKPELVVNTICCEIKAISSFSLCFTLGNFVKNVAASQCPSSECFQTHHFSPNKMSFRLPSLYFLTSI